MSTATSSSRKTRVHLLAKELSQELGIEVSSKDILDKCKAEGLDAVKNHMSLLTLGQEATIRDWFSDSHGTTAVEVSESVTEKIKHRTHKGDEHGGKADAHADDAGGQPRSGIVAPVSATGAPADAAPADTPSAPAKVEAVAKPEGRADAGTKSEPAVAGTPAGVKADTASTAAAAGSAGQAAGESTPAQTAPAQTPAPSAGASEAAVATAGSGATVAAGGTGTAVAASTAQPGIAPAGAAQPAAAGEAATVPSTTGTPTAAAASDAAAKPAGRAAVDAPSKVLRPLTGAPGESGQARPTGDAGRPPSTGSAGVSRPVVGTPLPPGMRPSGQGPSSGPGSSPAQTMVPGPGRGSSSSTPVSPNRPGAPAPARPGTPAPGAPAGPGARPAAAGGPGAPTAPGRPPLPGRPGSPAAAGARAAVAGAAAPAVTGPRKVIAPIPYVPEPPKLQGPNVIRVEQPDFVNKPRPRATFDDDDRGGGGDGRGRRPGGPGGGPGAGPGSGPGGPANRRRPQTTNKRRTGRDSIPQIRDFTQADIEEQRELMLRAKFPVAISGKGGKKPAVPEKMVTAKNRAAGGTVSVAIEEPITIKSLSAATGVRGADIMKRLISQGASLFTLTVNAPLTADQAEELAAGWNIELDIRRAQTASDRLLAEHRAREKGELVPRAPVVTILGHVDHGKTSLLDAIRSANVAAGEAGGITQHIAAWKVRNADGREVTFIDTPGHQAFTAMRARGANMTDIAVLVVSPFDGGVMQTTIEAIDHARAAKVPIVVALTKMDRPEVDENAVRKVYGQLAEHGLNPREWGGDVDVVRTSALKKMGLDELLDLLAFTAETRELRADPEAPASGRVVEARVDPERGKVATLLVQDGTMVVGDVILCGPGYGRVRAIFDDHGHNIGDAGPSTPVEIIGLDEVPDAGEFFFITDDLAAAKEAAEERRQTDRRKQLDRMVKPSVTLSNWGDKLDEGEVQELAIILRADVQGSVDALTEAIRKLGSSEVTVRIIRSAVGGISEADVELARAGDAVIVGFHVTPEDAARKLAEHYGVEIRLYQVIYEILDDITRVLEGKLLPEKKEEVLGHVEVRQVFKVSKVGTIAGCYVLDGKITRNSKLRISRNNVVIADGRELQSLRRVKDDVREVAAGLECGIKIDGFDDVKEGDRFEAYQIIEVARKL